ncbi:MAG: response regulator [Bacteroidetes bacterium]|nr:MAG: response regulator [Bacteroidota bacterium]
MGHILIADDHVFLLRALSILLSKEGYTFELAENGQQAIDLFERGSFDAVVTDIDMPIKNGYELIQHIRTGVKNSIPIIVLSSLIQGSDNTNIIGDSGASMYLSKTDSPIGILSALESVLAQAS